ncbi:MAG: ROK family protein [Cytophagaceae bacterium]|nr:ROK family protein [Cytophagaceae bacterium]
MDKYYLGIEIGGTKLQLVVGDDSGEILRRERYEVDRNAAAEGIRDQIENSIRELMREYRFMAAGVGFGGPINRKTTTISTSYHIEGWADFELSDWLESLLRCPIFADNDANTAALGEFRQGAGVGYEIIFYVTLGSGIGGGLVNNGKIFHGAVPGESEIGHLLLDRQGTTLESVASGWAVDAKIRALIAQNPESLLAQLAGGATGGEARFLVPALEQSDPLAQQILQETAEAIAFGLSHVVHLMHPEIIILGGGLSLMGESLCQAVEASLSNYIMEAFKPGPRVALAQLGEDAVPIGAMTLARRRLNNHEFE